MLTARASWQDDPRNSSSHMCCKRSALLLLLHCPEGTIVSIVMRPIWPAANLPPACRDTRHQSSTTSSTSILNVQTCLHNIAQRAGLTFHCSLHLRCASHSCWVHSHCLYTTAFTHIAGLDAYTGKCMMRTLTIVVKGTTIRFVGL